MEQLVRPFTLSSNEYLSHDCVGYYVTCICAIVSLGNPDSP